MFPSTLSTFPRPTPTNRLDNPSHSALHNTVSSAVGQIEAVIGVEGANSVVGTIMYDIQSPASDGGGHVQTANKGGTGQTSYSKGDLLVATSSSVLTKLAVGPDGTVPVANASAPAGIQWGAVPAIIVSSTIAVSSVWTKPAAATVTSRVFVELWGGGGAGGAGEAADEASGGGGGGYASGWFSASVLSSVLINVGRGGDSHLEGSGQASAGGITVFAPQISMLTAYGGAGGNNQNGGFAGGGGAGQLSSGGNAGITGQMFGGVMQPDGKQFINFGIGGINNSVAGSLGVAPQGGGGGYTNTPGTNNSASMAGGKAIYGGGGGGAMHSSVTSGSTLGGLSTFGGRGGNGSIITVGSAMAGAIPGGGGGASYSNTNVASSGQGGHGMAKITVFL